MRPKLSKTATGKSWLDQFAERDRATAAALLDALVLLNEEQVASAIRGSLVNLAAERKGRRKRVGLYAEREFPERQAFESQLIRDAAGVVHRRAVGRSGPLAVKTVRGSARVGSEGLIAFTISQVVEAWPLIFANQPGPDRIRSRRNPISALAIVTDFVGSGARIRTMLDKFWNVPSVRAWVSRGWVEFIVVAAAGTSKGLEEVESHRLAPRLLVQHVVPTISSIDDFALQNQCEILIKTYGPQDALGADRTGFGGIGALVAFNYRIPNNTPLLLHRSGGGWKALFTGAAPEDLRPVFGLETMERRIAKAATAVGVDLSPSLPVPDAEMILVLSAIRGRWREGSEVAIAEATGLTLPEVIIIRCRATKAGLLTAGGRLTDAGHAALKAGTRTERQRPVVPTSTEPYYPKALRVPRG